MNRKGLDIQNENDCFFFFFLKTSFVPEHILFYNLETHFLGSILSKITLSNIIKWTDA